MAFQAQQQEVVVTGVSLVRLAVAQQVLSWVSGWSGSGIEGPGSSAESGRGMLFAGPGG